MIDLYSAMLIVTNRCNLSCYYCYQKDFNNRFCNDSNEEVIRRSLNLLFKRNRNAAVYLWGGEPLLRPDLIKTALEVSKQFGNKLRIGTNGLLLEENIELINGSDIYISIDGTGKFNYRNTPEDVLNNKAWIKCDRSNVICVPVYDPGRNSGELLEQINSLIDIGFKNFHILVREGPGWNEEQFKLFEQGYDKLIELHLSGKIRITSLNDIKNNNLSCNWTQDKLACCVDISGNFYHSDCSAFMKENAFGDFESGIDEEKLSKLASQYSIINETKECSICGAKEWCVPFGQMNYFNSIGKEADSFSKDYCYETKAKLNSIKRVIGENNV